MPVCTYVYIYIYIYTQHHTSDSQILHKETVAAENTITHHEQARGRQPYKTHTNIQAHCTVETQVERFSSVLTNSQLSETNRTTCQGFTEGFLPLLSTAVLAASQRDSTGP